MDKIWINRDIRPNPSYKSIINILQINMIIYELLQTLIRMINSYSRIDNNNEFFIILLLDLQEMIRIEEERVEGEGLMIGE